MLTGLSVQARIQDFLKEGWRHSQAPLPPPYTLSAWRHHPLPSEKFKSTPTLGHSQAPPLDIARVTSSTFRGWVIGPCHAYSAYRFSGSGQLSSRGGGDHSRPPPPPLGSATGILCIITTLCECERDRCWVHECYHGRESRSPHPRPTWAA